MPPIDTRLTSPIGSVQAASLNVRLARTASGSSDQPAKAETAEATAVISDTLDAGEVPINAERVREIRKALENGTYPILPATVADGIIAAGLILRTPK
ncbi:MAG: flagellar biosynthesis anti-sigma factor FlgM [Novosphingobium sp.]